MTSRNAPRSTASSPTGRSISCSARQRPASRSSCLRTRKPICRYAAASRFRGQDPQWRVRGLLAQMDTYVGRLLDAVDELGIRDNTDLHFHRRQRRRVLPIMFGFTGPWRGTYFTGLEARCACRSSSAGPARFRPARSTTRSCTRWTCFRRLRASPAARCRRTASSTASISRFLPRQAGEVGPRVVVIYIGNDIYGVKWRNWKMMIKEVEQKAPAPSGNCQYPGSTIF